MGILTSILGGIGSFFTTLFGFKKEQAEVVGKAVDLLGQINTTEAQRLQAVATIISSEMQSGSWLAINWRPITALLFLGLVVSYWFGYSPPNIDKPMTPMIQEIFDLLKLCLGGYIGGRTVEKIIASLSLGKVLQTLINKKLL